MTNYTGTGRESGHTIIIHGAQALREYQADVLAGDAEELIGLSPGMDRAEHRWAREEGQCYGPCTLALPRLSPRAGR